MKKQLSLITRSLLLSGVAAFMLSSCIFVPPKEKPEVDPETSTVVPDNSGNNSTTPSDGNETPAEGNENQNGGNGTQNNGTDGSEGTATTDGTDGAGSETPAGGNGAGSGTGTGAGTGTEDSSDDTDSNVVLTKHGLNLVWQDEFEYSGVPDTSKWKYQTGAGGWGNNELQNYLDNTTEAKTAVVEDNVLKIKAYKSGSKWYSARLNTKESWKYGYIEARLKVTDRKGAWPAFWMMPQKSVYGGWPNSGEIDIMENAPSTCGNHKAFSTLHAEGHYAANGAGIGSKVYDDDFSSEWHTFGILWEEDKITCFYDDKERGSYSNNGTVRDWPYDEDFYIILNLAIGGDLGGTNDAGSLNGKAEFLVDYVRVYQ